MEVTPTTFPPYFYPIYCLFNNDTLGRSLHVLGMTISDDGLGRSYWDIGNGSTGTLRQNAIPVKFNEATPPGQVFSTQVSAATQTHQALPNVRGGIGSFFGTGPFLSTYPLWVIPPGQSLLISNFDGNLQTVINFWWVALAD